MTDIQREERTSIIPITLSLVDGKCYLSFKDGQGFPHKLELDVKLYALFDRFELDDIYYADLTPVVGCEQGGRRPVLVIQKRCGQPSRFHGHRRCQLPAEEEENGGCPTHIGLPRLPTGLRTASFAMLEQVRTIDRMAPGRIYRQAGRGEDGRCGPGNPDQLRIGRACWL